MIKGFFNISFKFIILLALACPYSLFAQDIEGEGEGDVDGDDNGTVIEEVETTKRRIIVGLKEEPPFIIKDIDGSFNGLSIDLWTDLAENEEVDIDFEYREFNDLTGMLRALDYNELDVVINPIILSKIRLKMFDASQPFFISSLGVATSSIPRNQFQSFVSNLFSLGFLKIIALLVVVILVFGSIVWWVEKRSNNVEFGEGFKGLMDGIWWAAVTMTTVGYGDKIPKSTRGRLISIVWMFTAIVLISSLTASITSRLTVNTLGFDIERLEDLEKLSKSGNQIGTVSYSSSQEYLDNHNIAISNSYDTPIEGLEALADGEIDVFVYDKPIMNYLLIKHELENRVKIMPITFNKHYCSFLVPKESQFLEQIDPVLIEKINVASWNNTLEKYNLGQGE